MHALVITNRAVLSQIVEEVAVSIDGWIHNYFLGTRGRVDSFGHWQRKRVIESQGREQNRIRIGRVRATADQESAIAGKMRQSDQRAITVREIVGKVALSDPIVKRVITLVQIGNVFEQIIDEEK